MKETNDDLTQQLKGKQPEKSEQHHPFPVRTA